MPGPIFRMFCWPIRTTTRFPCRDEPALGVNANDSPSNIGLGEGEASILTRYSSAAKWIRKTARLRWAVRQLSPSSLFGYPENMPRVVETRERDRAGATRTLKRAD